MNGQLWGRLNTNRGKEYTSLTEKLINISGSRIQFHTKNMNKMLTLSKKYSAVDNVQAKVDMSC